MTAIQRTGPLSGEEKRPGSGTENPWAGLECVAVNGSPDRSWWWDDIIVLVHLDDWDEAYALLGDRVGWLVAI